MELKRGIIISRHSKSKKTSDLEDKTKLDKTRDQIRYQSELVDSVSDAIISTDSDFKIKSWNKAAENIYGYSAKQVIGKSMQNLVDVYYINEDRKKVLNTFLKKGYWKGETLQKRKDGKLLNIYSSVNCIKDDNGNFLGAVAVNRDITDRKRIENQIIVANERLQYLLSSTQAVIYSAKAFGDFGATFVSDNVYKVTGFKPSDFLNNSSFWIDHIHPDDKKRILDDISKIFKKKTLSYEYKFRKRDRTYIWILDEMKLVEDKNGNPIEINGFWLDITDRKNNQEGINNLNLLLDTITSSTKFIIATIDRNCIFTYFNKEHKENIKRITGKDNKIGMSIKELFSEMPDQQKIALELWRRVLNGEKIEKVVEFGPKHYKRFYRTRYVPILDKKGKVVGAGEVSNDITEIKKTEEALRESEKKYRTLFDSMTEGFALCEIITDSNGKPIDYQALEVNQAWEKMTGLSATKVIGKGFKEVIPNLEQFWIDAYGKVALTGKPVHIENYNKFTSNWYEIYSYSPRKGYFVSLVKNINDRKKSEETLKISEEKYRNLFNTMSQGVVYQDKDGKIISCNPAAERILGLTINQMKGRTSLDPRWKAIHEDGTNFTGNDHPSMLSLKSGKKVRNVIMGVFNPKNKVYTWINIDAIPQFRAGEKKPYQVYTTFEDITQIKAAEKALKKSEERYKLAQRAAEIGSWDYNIKTGDLAWSDQIEPMFGFKKGKFGKTYEAFLDCIHPEDKKLVIDSVNACIEKNVKQDIEHRIVWPDGSIHWVREIGDLIRDKDGTPVRMIGIVQEITERKKNEEQIKKLNESLWQYTIRLEAANKEVEAFSYSVSHDLRAPLRSIDGFSQALLEDYVDKLDETGIDYLNRVRNASQRMGQLIDGMLQLSRLSRKEMHVEKVDMGELAVDIINKFRKEDSYRNVDFKIQDDLVTKGDKNLLQILLENLLGNAWKFTSKRSNAKIEFGKTEKKKEIVFFIRDNGAGFDVKYIDKLFVPFQRLHDDEFPGDGIGLGIVSRIIRRHGGQIWAEGEVGKGAIFYFKLGGKKYE